MKGEREMNQYENILVTISEECAEIQKAVSKALRFGLENHHPDQPDCSNADDILFEFIHLQTLIEGFQRHGYLPKWDDYTVKTIKDDKIKSMVKWQEVSFECGVLHGDKKTILKERDWISCSELLPEENDLVLVCAKGTTISDTKMVTLANYCDKHWTNGIENLRVMAWMPLPKPPDWRDYKHGII